MFNSFLSENIDLKLTDKEISATYSSLPILLSIIAKKQNKVAYLCVNEEECKKIQRDIIKIDDTLSVYIFPNFDCSFFSNISPSSSILSERIKILYKLLSNEKRIVLLLSMKSIFIKTINKDRLRNSIFTISKDTNYNQILSFIKNNKYEKVDFVRNKSEFAIRGEVLDLFSPNEDNPLRINFIFENVEKIANFDINTQRTSFKISKYVLTPASEIIYDNESIKSFREKFNVMNLSNRDYFYKEISKNNIVAGSEQFFPIMYESYTSIIDYLEDFRLIIDSEFLSQIDVFQGQLCDEYNEIDFLKNQTDFILKKSQFLDKINNSKLNILYDSAIDNDSSFKFSERFLGVSKNQKLELILSKAKKENISNFVFCFTTILNENKINQILTNRNIKFANFSKQHINFNPLISNYYSAKIFIESSFIIKIKKKKVLFISENDVFGKTLNKSLTKSSNTNFIDEVMSNLKLGDYIVHIEHGIGLFNGLKLRELENRKQEFIEIIYYNNDKLLIPVENFDLISKFGQSETNVNLDKLGLQNWQQRRANVKKRIKNIAKALIKTAAERKIQKGIVIESKTYEYEKFCSEFEFTETSDQLKSITNIEDDLRSGKPMDRLICGDVGFGKTEIAMRAAFITVSAGFQVVMICPKLLLANQHHKNFEKRFSKFKINIEKISRSESLKSKKQIKTNFNSGFINILIGTHAIFTDDIKFDNLGLMIIDEEQSFGVEQKEKLKKLKPNTHILTLSATPIPRTLQSSLLKIRDVSYIKTPPVDRLNVKTFLMLYDKDLIIKVINSELKRNGQVFYVLPRISDLEIAKKKLLKIMPNLNFKIIHGRLKTAEIENTYKQFFDRKIDLLLSTAMIESGLDFSNVNTIIIEKPFLFGLSQLYQLRGRVGRSSTQAYAYMILDKIDSISELAIKKLNIISKINYLGAGLSIATFDLDIRGGGNIVGSEQSGHIREVGIELYYKMINEAVSEVKDKKKIEEDWSPEIDLNFSANIPQKYIFNEDIRLNYYRKISNLKDKNELKEMISSLEDQFGKLPTSLQNLFKIIEIKLLSKKLFISKINLSNLGFVLEFKSEKVTNINNLIKLAELNPDKIKLVPNAKLIYYVKIESDDEKIEKLKYILTLLIKNKII